MVDNCHTGKFKIHQKGIRSKYYAFNAFQKTDYDKKGKFFFERYMSAHAIMIAFEGVPAIYFNSIFGTSNDEYKYIISGNKRDLNRYKWN